MLWDNLFRKELKLEAFKLLSPSFMSQLQHVLESMPSALQVPWSAISCLHDMKDLLQDLWERRVGMTTTEERSKITLWSMEDCFKPDAYQTYPKAHVHYTDIDVPYDPLLFPDYFRFLEARRNGVDVLDGTKWVCDCQYVFEPFCSYIVPF